MQKKLLPLIQHIKTNIKNYEERPQGYFNKGIYNKGTVDR